MHFRFSFSDIGPSPYHVRWGEVKVQYLNPICVIYDVRSIVFLTKNCEFINRIGFAWRKTRCSAQYANNLAVARGKKKVETGVRILFLEGSLPKPRSQA